jgi:hypothetical protein
MSMGQATHEAADTVPPGSALFHRLSERSKNIMNRYGLERYELNKEEKRRHAASSLTRIANLCTHKTDDRRPTL